MNNLFKKLIFLSLITFQASCVDNPHYYKAPYFNATKAWRTTDWLSRVDVHYASGTSSKSRNNNAKTADTFQIYGHHNLLYLTKDVPQPDTLTGNLLTYVNDLDAQRTNFENSAPADNQSFGCVDFCGDSKVDEFMINYRQNFLYNIFAELNIPFRQVKTGPIGLNDRSPSSSADNTPFTQTDSTWVNFITNLDAILQAYGYDGYQCETKNTGLGDISILGGWQYSMEKFKGLFEYIKLSGKIGLLFPTGEIREHRRPFSIETGYNGHFGIPIRLDAIVGLSKDIYMGGYFGFTSFSSKTFNNYPVKTDPSQNGFIKLFKTRVKESKGTLFDIGTYLKLDHFFQGLSGTVGYSYNRKSNSSLKLVGDCENTNNPIVNNDCRIKNWYQHVLHVLVEYDFGIHDFFKKKKWKPSLGIFYDYPFDGKRVIMNSMFGVSLGVNLTYF